MYDKSPDQLKTINAEKLKKMGVSTAVSTAFLDHPTYSLTPKTAIVTALERTTNPSFPHGEILSRTPQID